MVKSTRIQQVTISPAALTGSNLAKTYSDSINGEIRRISYNPLDVDNGSIWIAESGTDVEIWRNNAGSVAVASKPVEAYPFVYGVSNTNGTGSPRGQEKRVVNGPVYVAGSLLGSGNTVTSVNIYYT